MAFINIDDKHRIISASEKFHCGPNDIKVNFPQNFIIENAHDWTYDNGTFNYVPVAVEEDVNEYEQLKQQIADLQSQNDILTDCILELSEIVYGDNA